MATIEQIRAMFTTKTEPTKTEHIQDLLVGLMPNGDKYIIWSKLEVKVWSRTHTIISVGSQEDGNGIKVLDVRFNSGRYSGQTIRQLADQLGRTYIRWFYDSLTDRVTTHGMLALIRLILGESDECIRERAWT